MDRHTAAAQYTQPLIWLHCHAEQLRYTDICLNVSCSQKYDITLVSPRNYFLYTPLLPAVATGTVEERSIVEPIRRIMAGKVLFCLCPVTPLPLASQPLCRQSFHWNEWAGSVCASGPLLLWTRLRLLSVCS